MREREREREGRDRYRERECRIFGGSDKRSKRDH